MTPIQQLYLGVGAKKKTYMDDVFSTYVYEGTGSARSINNGINLSGEGGMTWIKSREEAEWHHIVDTVRGAGKTVWSNENNAEATDTNRLSSFNTNGFSVGTDYRVNKDDTDFSSWTFRKAPGFFDIVTYTGNGSARTIAHSLGSVPGSIWIKCTSQTQDWVCYHRGSHADPEYHGLRLNDSIAVFSAAAFNNTLPTSTNFSLGTAGSINGNGETYVAYVFAGGESTQNEAVSVDFDGSGDYLTTNTSSDYTLGTGDFTLEYWYKPDTVNYSTFIIDATGGGEVWGTYCNIYGQHKYRVGGTDQIISDTALRYGQWHHIAIVRASGTTKMYVNGVKEGSDYSDSTDYSFTQLVIGRRTDGSFQYDGEISNLRLVKGTAVYTSAFRPTGKPLTSISGTSLLCCNNSSVTGATTGTLTSSGDPTASTDSPFDDPAGFVFGENGDQNVIKCGSYTGNGSSTGPEINLGWEPQWLLIKNASTAKSWKLLDSMRGIVTGDMEAEMQADQSNAENTGAQRIDLTSTGFKVKTTSPIYNGDGDTYIFICLRRSDGYVGKPVETATSVFAIDTGNSSSAIPNFDSTFPVDFAWAKIYAGNGNWWTSARLIQGKELKTNLTDAEADGSNKVFDSNVGWHDTNGDSSYISHMWKRHAGFDVVTYVGNQASRTVNHNLNAVPEMIWSKDRTDSGDWVVYHKGLNAGTSGETPAHKFLYLNKTDAEGGWAVPWNDTEPTSVGFPVHASTTFNKTGNNYLTMLFASVDGVSSVGSYNGSSSTVTVTTGFQPRFVIIKRIDAVADWYLLDTTRGWGSGDDKAIKLNVNHSQYDSDMGAPTSTGFTVPSTNGLWNTDGGNYIYYAHA